MAALIILGITAKLKKRGVKLSEAIAAIEKYDNSGEINFRIEKKREAMDKVRDYFLSEESAVASFDFDGYRVEFPEWWFNIRPSNTEPYLRFLAEAKGADLLAQKVAKVKELLKEFE
jgi:phosphomannomutase